MMFLYSKKMTIGPLKAYNYAFVVDCDSKS